MANRELPSPELLRQLLDYDPETGTLHWRVRPNKDGWNKRYAGMLAFNAQHSNGYLFGNMDGRKFFAHRVAFAHYYGTWPDITDHINGVRTDNRIENLRSVDHRGNCRNTARSSRNKSGCVGIQWVEKSKRWKVSIVRMDGTTTCKYCRSYDDAVYTRIDFERAHGYHPNHGRELIA